MVTLHQRVEEVELDGLKGRLEGSPQWDSLRGEHFSCRNPGNRRKNTPVVLLHVYCRNVTLAEALLERASCVMGPF